MLRKLICALAVVLLVCACACAQGVESKLSVLKDGDEHFKLVNAEGKTIIDGLTQQPNFFTHDYAVVRKGTGVMETGMSDTDVEVSLEGLVSSQGEIVIPCEYDDLTYQDGMNFVRAEVGNYFGLLDLQGNVVFGFGYDDITLFSHNRAVLEKYEDGRRVYGMIDENAEFVLPLEYGYLELAGDEVIASEWTKKDGKNVVGLRGYMDLDGKWILKPKYNDAKAFRGNYAVVGMEKKNGEYIMPIEYGVIDRKGKIIVPCDFKEITLNDGGEGLASGYSWKNMPFQIEGNKYNFYYEHEDGRREILPDWAWEWNKLIPLQSDPKIYLAFRPSGSNPWSMLDAEGGVLHANALTNVSDFSSGVARIERDGLYGYMRIDGSLILPPLYQDADTYFRHGLAAVQDKNGLHGYIRDDGSWLVEPRLGDAKPFYEGFACAMDKGFYGYMDTDGNWLVEPVFDDADSFENGFAIVQQGKKYGVVSTAGKLVLPVKYDELSSISTDHTATAVKDEKSTIFRLTADGAEEVKIVGSDLVLEDYMPFTGKKLAKLGEEPTLEERASADHGHPRLDGATALFPVYSAVVEAVYPEKTRYEEESKDALITCTKTNRAYERLIEGKADIIFCAGPSDAQVRAAKAMGVEFELTPFGKEAFVFIVNKENPLSDISVENIRRVYSGEITEWEELGVEGLGGIVAYQRPANSGSQTALERLMGDTPIMEAPSEYISTFMDDILETIEYRNLPNAIGYTFRFFCTEMIGSDVKLLSIDGVEPSLDNIRNESYPITSTLYMVTRKGEENPNVQALMDWVLSEQGQSLVEKAGYVGVN